MKSETYTAPCREPVQIDIPETPEEAAAGFGCPVFRCSLLGHACAARHLSGLVGHSTRQSCAKCPAGAARAALLDSKAPAPAVVLKHITNPSLGRAFFPKQARMFMDENKAKILAALAGGRMAEGAIAQQTGLGKLALRAALQTLEADGEVKGIKIGRGYSWMLPSAPVAAVEGLSTTVEYDPVDAVESSDFSVVERPAVSAVAPDDGAGVVSFLEPLGHDEPSLGVRAEEAEGWKPSPIDHPAYAAGKEWCRLVDEAASNGPVEDGDFPPVPTDGVAQFVRSWGELGEAPALALLDEIDRLRQRRLWVLEGLRMSEVRAGEPTEAEMAAAGAVDKRVLTAAEVNHLYMARENPAGALACDDGEAAMECLADEVSVITQIDRGEGEDGYSFVKRAVGECVPPYAIDPPGEELERLRARLWEEHHYLVSWVADGVKHFAGEMARTADEALRLACKRLEIDAAGVEVRPFTEADCQAVLGEASRLLAKLVAMATPGLQPAQAVAEALERLGVLAQVRGRLGPDPMAAIDRMAAERDRLNHKLDEARRDRDRLAAKVFAALAFGPGDAEVPPLNGETRTAWVERVVATMGAAAFVRDGAAPASGKRPWQVWADDDTRQRPGPRLWRVTPHAGECFYVEVPSGRSVRDVVPEQDSSWRAEPVYVSTLTEMQAELAQARRQAAIMLGSEVEAMALVAGKAERAAIKAGMGVDGIASRSETDADFVVGVLKKLARKASKVRGVTSSGVVTTAGEVPGLGASPAALGREVQLRVVIVVKGGPRG